MLKCSCALTLSCRFTYCSFVNIGHADIIRSIVSSNCYYFIKLLLLLCRSQWPRGLRRRSTAARPLRLWVRIPPAARIYVCCECCVLSGRGLCNGLITRIEESYRLWHVVVCDQETSRMKRLKSATGLWKYNQKGCNAKKTNIIIIIIIIIIIGTCTVRPAC